MGRIRTKTGTMTRRETVIGIWTGIRVDTSQG